MVVKLYVQPLLTSEIIERFAKIFEDACGAFDFIGASFQTPLGHYPVQLGCKGKEVAERPNWKALAEQFKSHSYLECSNISANFNQNWTLRYQFEGNPLHPQVHLEASDNQLERASVLRVLDSINGHFIVIPQTQIAARALSETQLAGMQFAERTIASFATEAARLSQSTVKNFEDFVAGVKTRSLELEQQFHKKADELDNLYRQKQDQLEAEHATKLKVIEEREKLHAEEVQKFELRNNTVVRRDLLKEIRSKIEEQTSIVITAPTVRKRMIIHVVCVVTMFAALGLVGVYAYKLFNQTAFDWKLLVPLSTWTALFATTAIYYIRWNDQWFREHARVEFENRKFSADILRASWVAELFFEWAEKKGINMPPELVGSFTKNLFENANLDGNLHPTDQLNDMIKQFSSLELSKGGIKITRKDEAKT